MNCTFVMAIAQLYDEPALEQGFRDTESWKLGLTLLELLGEEPDDATGDCVLVDRWAEILGVRGWCR